MQKIINLLEKRFHAHPYRHPNLVFEVLKNKLNDRYFAIIEKMEETGGEPDVIIYNGELYIVDFYQEAPLLRVNMCYDKAAREKRKKFPPESSAMEQCDQIGTKLVDEAMYRYMQSIDNIDLKTSSWLFTPEDIRSLGGALFGDKRYNHTFIYHNGADSYYSVRGFRSFIKLD